MEQPASPEPQPATRTGHQALTCIASAWQSHEGELRGYLRHRLSDHDSAEDLLQDVFVKALRQGQGFCALNNPRAWLYQVARNALVDRVRTTHPTEPMPQGTSDLPEPPHESPPPVDALAGCLDRALRELSAEDADIVRACDLQGQAQRSFAEAHGLTLPATKSRLLRARQRLRSHLIAACQITFEADGSVAGHVARPAVG